MDGKTPSVCVLDSSTYIGFWVLKGLLKRGYKVHAAVQKNGEREIIRRIKEMEKVEEKMVVFDVDVLDYYTVLASVKGCSGLICCLDNPDGYDERSVDLEVRGAINVVEACARSDGLEKVVFSSSLTAAVWRESIGSQRDVDERSWSDPHFCRKMKLWQALAKTLSEKAAWALAMDRATEMVSVNPGLVIGPDVAELNPEPSLSYLKGAAQMFENGVLAFVNVEFLVDVHIRAFQDQSTRGRYLCFNGIVKTDGEAIKLAENLNPLILLPPRYEGKEQQAHEERLQNKKLNKLVEGMAY